MQRNLFITADGSHSVEVSALQVSYHSRQGAIQESLHVFIKEGLQYRLQHNENNYTCHILEMGFGTGLNALLTFMEAEKQQLRIYYETIEAYPLEADMVAQLNYCKQLQRPDLQDTFHQLHNSTWNEVISITPFFTLKKINTLLINFSTGQLFHIIYYDAFAPNVQSELWTVAVFRQLYNLLLPGGILVTYCSKGDVRRAMQEAGFIPEKIPGPSGKREMIRAWRK